LHIKTKLEQQNI